MKRGLPSSTQVISEKTIEVAKRCQQVLPFPVITDQFINSLAISDQATHFSWQTCQNRTVEIMVSWDNEKPRRSVLPKAGCVQYGFKQMVGGGHEFVGLARESEVASEDDEVDLSKCWTYLSAFSNILKQRVANYH